GVSCFMAHDRTRHVSWRGGLGAVRVSLLHQGGPASGPAARLPAGPLLPPSRGPTGCRAASLAVRQEVGHHGSDGTGEDTTDRCHGALLREVRRRVGRLLKCRRLRLGLVALLVGHVLLQGARKKSS